MAATSVIRSTVMHLRRRELAVIMGMGAVGQAAAEALPCPPHEAAALSSYAQCSDFARTTGDTARATKLEAHANGLREACNSSGSVFIGIDPYRDLLDCAESLARAGRLDDARKVEPTAQAYREEQVLRLMMRSGNTLDAMRYYGLPSDHVERRAALPKAEERISTPDFSIAMPRGGGWRMLPQEPGLIAFSKDPSWFPKRPQAGQSVALAVAMMSPKALADVGAAEFPSAFEAWMRDGVGGRFRSISSITVKAVHRGRTDEFCVDYEVAWEERDHPSFPDVTLETRNKGFACLVESARYLVQAFLSERKPQGSDSVIDDVIQREADAFLRGITVKARRERTAD